MVDPGWRPAFRYVPRGVLGAPFLSRTKDPVPRVVIVRAYFIVVILMGVVVTVVTFLVQYGDSPDFSTGVGVALAVVAGIVAIVGTRVAISRRPLERSVPDSLGAAYQAQFFLRVAFADGAFLVAFVAAFASETAWVVLVGLPFAAGLLARAAPTSQRIAKDEFELNARGGSGSLSTALFRPDGLEQGA